MLDCVAPGPDEIVLPTTSSSVFQSTNLDYLLRNLGVRQLVVCGCVTGAAWNRLGAIMLLVGTCAVGSSQQMLPEQEDANTQTPIK